MIGLLVRLVYQHYSQAMEAALREAGFEDIGPSAGNVFPFVAPEGTTVTELAELAHVRKQTMAQAVEQLEIAGYVERKPNPNDRRSQLVFLTDRGGSVPPIDPCRRSADRGALGRAHEPQRARGPSKVAAKGPRGHSCRLALRAEPAASSPFRRPSRPCAGPTWEDRGHGCSYLLRLHRRC